mgnify:CR=1 FL=1
MNYRRNTICVQGGYEPKNGEPRVTPICQSTTYKYDSSETVGKLFDLEENSENGNRQIWFAHPSERYDEVEYAFLEPNGKLSIFKYNLFKMPSSYPMPLILDGSIQKKALKQINKNISLT